VARATVREATYELLRRFELTDVFSNPGSTEVAFLGELPDDFRFLLGLHEGAVVGMASGYALARRQPSFVLLHTTAGLANAINALATARVNRTPLVVVVGQQDRRHLAFEPFLAGRLEGLAGTYPVWFQQPPRAQDVVGAIARAYHEAATRRGPALVVVPMDDWLAEAGEPHEIAAPERVIRPPAGDPGAVAALARLLAEARAPAIVAGAGNDTADGWAALVALAERLGSPVWQEAFSGQAGFPQDHDLFAGHLPTGRAALRETLAPHDVVLAVGAPVFRQYGYEPGPFVVDGTRVAVVTEDPEEAHRSPAELAVLATPAAVCATLAAQVPERPRGEGGALREPPETPAPPAAGEPLRGGHVLAALAERLPPDAVVVEECPSNRPELERRLAARRPLGFVSAAMGGLGWGLPAAAGLRLGLPDRPVIAVLGDGSTLFGVHGLWSAAHYGVGVVYMVLKNGGYRVMDDLASASGEATAWPSFENVDIAGASEALGCSARRITQHAELTATLDEVVPSLREREAPLLLEVEIAPR
jgi:benzoylformate decarboxylase